ncbi:unnamed protein product [Protopolystoma xenopodis]|uniref:Uncharacterized protein n=1 Tax=Protopolystoma xenopodis TaxID=117903 RepID=A0A448X4S5_9PLAT|nr:unnamed protein product [Protopolystoma xenopodis]
MPSSLNTVATPSQANQPSMQTAQAGLPLQQQLQTQQILRSSNGPFPAVSGSTIGVSCSGTDSNTSKSNQLNAVVTNTLAGNPPTICDTPVTTVATASTAPTSTSAPTPTSVATAPLLSE